MSDRMQTTDVQGHVSLLSPRYSHASFGAEPDDDTQMEKSAHNEVQEISSNEFYKPGSRGNIDPERANRGMKCLQRIKIQEMNIRYLKIAHTMLCVRKIFQKKGLHGVVKLLPRIDRRAERLLGSLYDSNDDECHYNHVGSIQSCEADRRYGIYEGALAGAEHPNRKRIPEEVVSTPPRVVDLDGQFSDREEFTHSAIRFVVKANNQASELSPSQPAHTLNVNGTVSPCCPTDAGQKQLVFTCPFTDCGKRVPLLLGVNDIHDHYLREIPECTHPLIHELKHWTMDNGCILHENCTRFNATKVKCPARHCRALFTTPARWVKHVIRKHPNCIS